MDILFGIVLVAVLWGLWYIQSPGFKGKVGEARVRSAVGKQLPAEVYKSFDDLTLPSRGGTTQVDHVIVSRFGVFVVETKNMKGWIFGSANQASWTQVIYGKKTKFQNPLRQNFKHVKAVQELLGLPENKILNVVVFTGAAEPKTAMPPSIVWGAKNLPAYVTSKRTQILGDLEVQQILAKLESATLQTTPNAKREHVKHVRKLRTERPSRMSCPRCRSSMVVRTNRKTEEEFWGCSRFPKCKGTRHLL